MENRKPIGVFDSGLGGLTALGALRRLMPNEDVIYFGDSARIPYGTKSPTVIKKFALQDTRFLMSLGVKAILIACGTVSSNCLDDVEAVAGVPVVGVIDEAARQAADIAKNGKNRVAVLGTSATVNSGAFEKELRKNGVGEIINQACPMFVPLVENWHHSVEDTATNAIVSEYIDPVAEKSPDAVILGCTHYPLLADVISKYLPDTKLISSGEAAALGIKKLLTEKCLLNDVGGKTEFYTSGGEKLFSQNASRFLGEDIAVSATHIDIENY
ncbi:MAG: glutamate racemase [Clostridia bacterium]|nr:glutamate racemase [Clostridia bacterium]